MKLRDLYTTLAGFELQSLNCTDKENITIKPNHQTRVLIGINEALTRLYTRFPLKEKIVIIELVEHITYYHLDPCYAESRACDLGTRFPYIKDMHCEPFEDDVVRILNVFDSYGNKKPLNDSGAPMSIFIPKNKTLQVPNPVPGVALSIAYQALHPKLLKGDDDVDIEVPQVLVGALTAYVGYKMYTSMNTPEMTAKGQEYLALFGSICDDAELTDTAEVSVSTSETQFEKNGWV